MIPLGDAASKGLGFSAEESAFDIDIHHKFKGLQRELFGLRNGP